MEFHVNFFRQYVQAGYFKLAKIASKLNPSDALTKAIGNREAFRAAVSHFMRELPYQLRPTTRSIGGAQHGTAALGSGGDGPTTFGGSQQG